MREKDICNCQQSFEIAQIAFGLIVFLQQAAEHCLDRDVAEAMRLARAKAHEDLRGCLKADDDE